MRPYLEIPLLLLPAFLFTSEVLLARASAAVDTRRINPPKSRSPDSSENFNLTLCAKQCRAEFFQYCHSREPDAKGDSNTFRMCMCVYKSGTQYMDHCARHCSGEASFPEQVGELRAWWSAWCEKHEPTPTTSISISHPSGYEADLDESKIPGMSLIGYDRKSWGDSLPPSATPLSKPKTTTESKEKSQGVSVITAGASVTFASVFLFLSYVMFMRRSKYARRRGVLAWLRLKFLERGYRGGGLPRSHTTAMRMRVMNGRTAVVGNPKWLNKTMPPLPQSGSTPQSRSTNTWRGRDLRGRDLRGSGNDSAHTRTNSGFLSRLMGRQEQKTPRGLMRGGVLRRNQDNGKSRRYSQGWLNAAKKYTDDAEEDEKVQNYYRNKGIGRARKYIGINYTANGNALPESASDRNESLKDFPEKMYGEGDLDVGDADEGVEAAESGQQRQHDEEYIEGLIALTSRNAQPQHDINNENYEEDENCTERTGRSCSPKRYLSTGRHNACSSRSASPEGGYVAISATPHSDGIEWDSLTGIEGAQTNATGSLRRILRIPDEIYGNGGLDFEEVDLVEREYDGTGYGWTARSDTHRLQFPSYPRTNINTTQGSSGYGPIHPVIEPEPPHGKKSTDQNNQQQHSKTRSKWRISGNVPKSFLGRKGKRSSESGSTNLGGGAYESV
ncbi:hypothetical protein EV426DRAFT_19361 [Tirmania nivea]|nr:hypothetical protein EV426DRAFT_19361 [Tirmania nivea]